MTVRNDLRDVARDDERRKRDEAKIQTLQAQIDELRAMTREFASRQIRMEDQFKTSDATIAQYRITLEQHRHEVAQSGQARQLEEARVRQQMSDLSTRIDDSTRPIRSLQAHVAELLETVRRQRDDVSQDTKRFDDLRSLIDHLGAHSERQIVVSQALRDSIENVRVELERQQRDLLRIDDAIKIVDQDARRRVAEVVQQIQNVSAKLSEEFGGVNALSVRIDDLDQTLATVWPHFEVLRDAQQHLDGEISRYHAQSVERDDLVAERIEEIRQQADAQLSNLEAATTQRFERLTARTEQLDEIDRELAYRLSLLEMQLEELNRVDQRVRREMWYLNEQRARLKLEQAQQEYESVMDARRQAEQRQNDRPTNNGQEN
jgi:chromosome segregation ATPase